MRIEGYELQLSSWHEERVSLMIRERFEVRNGPTQEPEFPWTNSQAYTLEISPEALAKSQEVPEEDELPPELKERARIVELLVELFTGCKVSLAGLKLRKPEAKDEAWLHLAPANRGMARPGWGLAYDYQRILTEEEHISFTGQGVVKTAGGRTVSFELSMAMSRSLVVKEGFSLHWGAAAVDPLVLSFSNDGIRMGEGTWDFDLNGDGVKERLAQLAPGSGFLVLDKNGDSSIGDGSELFGPTSGDGFKELAIYDLDGNGWIDENDPVYSKLGVWVLPGDRGMAFSLRDMGVGAIFLGRVAAPYSLRDGENWEVARLSSGGLYLSENGQAGFVGQVDLVPDSR